MVAGESSVKTLTFHADDYEERERSYESIVVLAPNLGDEKFREELAKFEAFLGELGAQSIESTYWGCRDLSFEKKKFKQGLYACIKYTTKNMETVSELANWLRIQESVLLFQSHRLN